MIIARWMLSTVLLGALMALCASSLSRLAAGLRMPRRWLVLMAMVLSVVLPVLFALRTQAAPQPVPALDSAARVTSWVAPVANASFPSRTDVALVTLWLVSSLVFAGTVAVVHWRTRLQLAASPQEQFFGHSVRISGELGPAAVGLVRPEIVLPDWVHELTPGDQRLILLHEREHIRAADHLVLLCGVLVMALMPWNAALWYQLRRLRIALELDCDARVAPTPQDRPRYSQVLLNARQHRSSYRTALALASSPSALAERLTTLLDASRPSAGRVVAWCATVIISLYALPRVPVPALSFSRVDVLRAKDPVRIPPATAPAMEFDSVAPEPAAPPPRAQSGAAVRKLTDSQPALRAKAFEPIAASVDSAAAVPDQAVITPPPVPRATDSTSLQGAPPPRGGARFVGPSTVKGGRGMPPTRQAGGGK